MNIFAALANLNQNPLVFKKDFTCYTNRLKSGLNGKNMDFVELKPGKSVEGDEIRAYRTETKSPHYHYLMAGVHGDEVEGVFILKELFTWLQENDEIDIPLIIIPCLNVDGYRAGTRTNSHGVDLNRNLPSEFWTAEARDKKYNPGEKALSEPENRFLVKLFEKYPPKLILSFHSWKPMLNYNGDDCQKYADHIGKFNGYPVVADIEGHPTPGSLGEFGPEKFGAQVLTFEAPTLADSDGKSLKDIWEENKVGLKSLLSSELLS